MVRESFVFYSSFHEATKHFTDEQYGKIMRIINDYALNGIVPVIEDQLLNMVFILVKPQIDANNKRYKNSQSGGRTPNDTPEENENFSDDEEKPTDFSEKNQRFLEKKPNDNVNENENVNENDTHTEKKSEKNSEKKQSVCACDFPKNIISLINEHNKTVPNEQKIPVTKYRINKLLQCLPQDESPERITEALKNYLSVAKMDTWKNAFSLKNFSNDFQDFLPEFFSEKKYFREKPKKNFLDEKNNFSQEEKKPPDKKFFSWFICKNCGAVHALDEPSCPNCGSKNREIATGETYPDTYDKAG